ncbi:CRISPR-associated endonuclease Cas1 [Trichothermofontia sichuanensis B231]|uniref:CRISPR-associated endonuclease Cas1 n=1 Tax=Trichothermofontia sichuanensis TaxID=3045816 RepID=UPI002246F9D5|nr:CRISPR-associated endonuclease Cas1 [Trichothermofontia sichuanensis]UZQ56000.1 CRISPR-associated endonuclease Cas1 [Trichothermofontia sichuanensis B231]
MLTLYLSQQGCYVSLHQETLVVKRGDTVLQSVQLLLVEQILVFGKSQSTTQVIRACLWREIPIAYLSRQGYCYGRVLAIARGYRQLARYQQGLSRLERLLVAQRLVQVKLKNGRVLLLRQQRRVAAPTIALAIETLDHLAQEAMRADSADRLMGLEGAGAASYFAAFGECLSSPDFAFMARSRRPPGNAVNAMLSFGYQVLWNHLLSLIELQGLDPYYGCLHEGSERHAALASDLLEEFRAPLIDSLVLWLVNSRVMDAEADFEFRDGGCFLGESGRKKFLQAFVQRMEEKVQVRSGERQPRWDLLNQQVKMYKQFVYNPGLGYEPYLIR